MPLITIVRNWWWRRTDDSLDTWTRLDPYAPSRQWNDSVRGWAMFLILIVTLPASLFLVGVGLVYELVIRVDRRPLLPSIAHWTIALGATAAVVVAMLVLAWPLT